MKMIEIVYKAINAANEIEGLSKPPEEPARLNASQVLPFALTKGTRGYIEKVALQINIAYRDACFDACLVMIRRLVETLIIECFEENNLKAKIEDGNGNYFFLRDLISIFVAESSWKPSSTIRKALPSLKEVGDKSAHSRKHNAFRQDVDDIIPALRTAIGELLYISKIRK